MLPGLSEEALELGGALGPAQAPVEGLPAAEESVGGGGARAADAARAASVLPASNVMSLVRWLLRPNLSLG